MTSLREPCVGADCRPLQLDVCRCFFVVYLLSRAAHLRCFTLLHIAPTLRLLCWYVSIIILFIPVLYIFKDCPAYVPCTTILIFSAKGDVVRFKHTSGSAHVPCPCVLCVMCWIIYQTPPRASTMCLGRIYIYIYIVKKRSTNSEQVYLKMYLLCVEVYFVVLRGGDALKLPIPSESRLKPMSLFPPSAALAYSAKTLTATRAGNEFKRGILVFPPKYPFTVLFRPWAWIFLWSCSVVLTCCDIG